MIQFRIITQKHIRIFPISKAISFIICTKENLNCNLINCTFNNLQTQAQSGGCIGLLFTNSIQHYLYFKGTNFMNLLFKNPNYGGGAISFASEVNENQKTEVTVIHCNFYNVTTMHGGGGAIHYNSPLQKLTVEDSDFSYIKAESGDSKGGAIYVKCSSGLMPISIKNCTFENTQAAYGGAICIDKNYQDSSEITIDNCTFKMNTESIKGNSIMITESIKARLTNIQRKFTYCKC